jgi:mandelamide amidase
VEDIILVDAAVNGYEPSKIRPTPLKGLRIGVPRYSFYEGMDPETARLTADALKKLQAQGVVLVEKDIADIDKLDRDVDFPMSLYECKRDFAAFFDPYGIKIEDVIAKIGSPDVKYSFDHFVLGKEAVTAEAYREVMTKYRPIMLKAYDDYFKANKVDFIIIPTTIAPAKPIAGSDESVEINGKKVPTFPTYVKNTSPGSNVGVAGISLPIGLTKDGLPVGIEVDTKSGNDEALLSLALALSKVFGPAPMPKGY